MNIKRYTVLFSAICVILAASAAAVPTAASILSAMRAKMSAAPSVDAVFTINGSSSSVQGSLILSGAKYAMTTPQMSVWFDGKTQYTLLAGSDEVNVTEPDADELMESNPFAILSAHQDYYTARRLPDRKGCRRVELVPRDRNSAVGSFVILVNSTTGWPAALEVHFDDGREIEVIIDAISAGKARSNATFSFDASRYPACEIIDLR